MGRQATGHLSDYGRDQNENIDISAPLIRYHWLRGGGCRRLTRVGTNTVGRRTVQAIANRKRCKQKYYSTFVTAEKLKFPQTCSIVT
jgi:hypothetical protein